MTVNVKTLTGGEVQGSGVFDELMRTVKAHLTEEFSQGRISNSDYANVYLQSMQAVLAQATQYSLQYQLAAEQLTLAQEQVTQSRIQTDVLGEQLTQAQNQNALLAQQLINTQAEKLGIDARTSLTEQQENQVLNQIAIGTKQIEVMTAQVTNTTAQTELVNQNRANTLNQNTTITKQQNKLDSEIGILDQKRLTEQAQVSNTINGANVEGILGRQMNLFTEQAKGFEADRVQKGSKIYSDMWATLLVQTDGGIYPVDENGNPSNPSINYGFTHTNMDEIMSRLRTSTESI